MSEGKYKDFGITPEMAAHKADAVMGFVNHMIGALDAGYIDDNCPSLATVYRSAQHFCKDKYGVENVALDKLWGKEVADLCKVTLDKI